MGNDCLDAIDLLDAAGLALMDWQQVLLETWMGYGADGKWAARNCGNQTPRQNGKTRVIQGRAAVEMLVFGGTVIYTSQLQKTSTETFNEFKGLFESAALRKYVAPNGIKTALGREEIVLKNGARIKFLARTRNGGDGQHGSLLVFDEAQALDAQAQESFMFAISACRTERGAQIIYNGTCPKEGDYAAVFEKLRADAVNGRSESTAWTEWSAGYGGAVPDIRDEAIWERTNPSYGILIAPDTIRAEVESGIEPERFAHQRLGWWTGERAGQTLIDAKRWTSLEADKPSEYEKMAAGVRVSADGATVTLSVALKLEDGRAHVDFIREEPTTNGYGWLIEWICARKDKLACVAIDGRAGADELKRRLIDAGMSKRMVSTIGTAGAIASASALVSMVIDGTVTHQQDDTLDASATESTRRKIGNAGGFGFGGEHPEPIDSAAIALNAVLTTTRDPRRRAIVRC